MGGGRGLLEELGMDIDMDFVTFEAYSKYGNMEILKEHFLKNHTFSPWLSVELTFYSAQIA